MVEVVDFSSVSGSVVPNQGQAVSGSNELLVTGGLQGLTSSLEAGSQASWWLNPLSLSEVLGILAAPPGPSPSPGPWSLARQGLTQSVRSCHSQTSFLRGHTHTRRAWCGSGLAYLVSSRAPGPTALLVPWPHLNTLQALGS